MGRAPTITDNSFVLGYGVGRSLNPFASFPAVS